MCTCGLAGLHPFLMLLTHGPAVRVIRRAWPRGQPLSIALLTSSGLTRMDVKRCGIVRKSTVLTTTKTTETLLANDCFLALHPAQMCSLNNNKSIHHNKPVGREVFN